MQEEIRALLAGAFSDAEIDLNLDGNRALIEIVSSHFDGMSRVQRQQAVYAVIADYIADGRLHAVTIKAQSLKP
ncbi:MAG: BolA/IbaG family iron-sulfur metabolism protein [Pseudomonadales bacterium]|jgi:acid stress-induced BolA-like protein IbaG/YrbA|nr:BolA/IbaG family iron-sulfur metabolism protein [Pseudomonadales bacterium]